MAPHGASVRFDHDEWHRITQGEDSLGHRVEYFYNDRDQVIRVVDSREGTTRYFYDFAGNMR